MYDDTRSGSMATITHDYSSSHYQGRFTRDFGTYTTYTVVGFADAAQR